MLGKKTLGLLPLPSNLQYVVHITTGDTECSNHTPGSHLPLPSVTRCALDIIIILMPFWRKCGLQKDKINLGGKSFQPAFLFFSRFSSQIKLQDVEKLGFKARASQMISYYLATITQQCRLTRLC